MRIIGALANTVCLPRSALQTTLTFDRHPEPLGSLRFHACSQTRETSTQVGTKSTQEIRSDECSQRT